MENSVEFTLPTALKAAEALIDVLSRRTHRKEYMGEIYVIRGALVDALKLRDILKMLNSPTQKRRSAGLERFQDLWPGLSETTRREVLDAIGWYDPRDLDWDDPRSNRAPTED